MKENERACGYRVCLWRSNVLRREKGREEGDGRLNEHEERREREEGEREKKKDHVRGEEDTNQKKHMDTLSMNCSHLHCGQVVSLTADMKQEDFALQEEKRHPHHIISGIEAVNISFFLLSFFLSFFLLSLLFTSSFRATRHKRSMAFSPYDEPSTHT